MLTLMFVLVMSWYRLWMDSTLLSFEAGFMDVISTSFNQVFFPSASVSSLLLILCGILLKSSPQISFPRDFIAVFYGIKFPP